MVLLVRRRVATIGHCLYVRPCPQTCGPHRGSASVRSSAPFKAPCGLKTGCGGGRRTPRRRGPSCRRCRHESHWTKVRVKPYKAGHACLGYSELAPWADGAGVGMAGAWVRGEGGPPRRRSWAGCRRDRRDGAWLGDACGLGGGTGYRLASWLRVDHTACRSPCCCAVKRAAPVSCLATVHFPTACGGPRTCPCLLVEPGLELLD